MVDQAEKLRDMMKNNHSINKNTKKINSESNTRIIAVTSGKGGVGKTNFAINLALAYNDIGKKVIVMDADLGLANVNVCMGIIPKYNLYHLVKRQKKMKDIIVETEYGIGIVAGASGFSKMANLDEEQRMAFVDELDNLSYADIIIVDTGAGVSQNVISFVSAANEVIVVTTPEPTAITDAYGIIKIIATEVNNLNQSLKLVVNRVQTVVEGKRVAEKVINIAGQFLNINIENLGFIYEDPVVQSSVLKQKPFYLQDSKCKSSICIRHILSRLERIEVENPGGLRKFLNKLYKSFKSI